jgi:hypothetical protein
LNASAGALGGGDHASRDDVVGGAPPTTTAPTPPTVRALADRVGANHRSVYRWRKDEARLARLVEEEGRGTCKRAGDDPMSRLKGALKAFHAVQYGDDAASADADDDDARRGGNRGGPPSLTGTIVSTKARQIRDELLARHGYTPFLTDAEVKALKDFTGSTSWGRKIVHKFGWKVATSVAAAASTTTTTTTTTAVTAERASEEPDDDDDDDDDDEGNVGGKTPHPSSSPHVSRTTSEMKREIASLRRKLHCAEVRAREVEAENAGLKSRLATLTNNINVGTDVGSGSDNVTTNGSNRSSGGREGGGLSDGDAGTGVVAADAFANAAAELEGEGIAVHLTYE